MDHQRIKQIKITFYAFPKKQVTGNSLTASTEYINFPIVTSKQITGKKVRRDQLTPLTCSNWNSISSGTVARNMNVLYPNL